MSMFTFAPSRSLRALGVTIYKQVGRFPSIQGLWSRLVYTNGFHSMCGLYGLEEIVSMNCQESDTLNT